MTKVVYRKNLKSTSSKKGKAGSVTTKKVRSQNGRLVTVRTIDLHSPTFGDDFGLVFTKNVAKARRENRKIFGASDRAGR